MTIYFTPPREQMLRAHQPPENTNAPKACPSTKPAPDLAAMVQAANLLRGPHDILETRILLTKAKKRTITGYFDAGHIEDMASFAARLNERGASVYITLNPPDAQLLARYCNRFEDYAQSTTTDADIIRRRWLLIDLDPVRPKDTPATDAQFHAAQEKAEQCRRFLADMGWPEPISAESGNGMHLLYRVDLPNDKEAADTIKRVLEGLAERFDDAGVKVDRSVWNAGRITKLYGTVSTKGDHTDMAPWRVSRIVSAPDELGVVTPDQLRAVHPAKPTGQKVAIHNASSPGAGFDFGGFMERLDIPYTLDTHSGSQRYKLDHCPFNPEHGRGESAIFRDPAGKLGFRCMHDSCADRTWQDVRALIDGPKESRTPKNVFNVQTLIASGRAREPRAAEEGLPLVDTAPADVDALLDTLPANLKDQARQVRAAIPYIPGTALLGGDEHRRPMSADVVIGYALADAYGDKPATRPFGAALAGDWDALTGGGASGVYDRADPNYRGKGSPITLDSVFRLARDHEWTGLDTGVASAARHDEDTVTPPPKPHGAMLYGLVGDVARAAAEGTEVNPVATAAVFLSFLGANVGRDVYLPLGNTWHHPRAYFLHIGRSGRGGKGDSQGLVHRIRRRIEEMYSGTLGATHTGGLSTREGLALLIHDGFKDGKTDIPAIADKRLWVVESEFANVLHQSKRDGNTLSAAMRDAWDGTSIKPAIKTSRVWASKPHIGLLGNVTPTELLDMLAAREMSNGFANRFLMVWAETIGLVPFPQPTPKHIVDSLADRTAEIIAFAKGGYPTDHDTRPMILGDGARTLYDKAYKALRRPLGSELLTAVLERRAPYAMRLAMLFALTNKSLVIREEHMRAALAWVQYAQDTVKFVFAERAGLAEAEAAEADAARVLAFVRGRPEGATATEITNEVFGKKRSSSAAIKALLTANPPRIEAEARPRPDGTPGRKTVIYRAISCAAADFSEKAEKGSGQGFLMFSEKSDFSELSSPELSPPGWAGRHMPSEKSEKSEKSESSEMPENSSLEPISDSSEKSAPPDEIEGVI